MELEELQQWARSLAEHLETLKKRRADLDSEIQQQSKKLELVRQMLMLEGGDSEAGNAQPAATVEMRATPASVRQWAKAILTDAGQPLHINEIHRQFIERGYAIPGGRTPFNILVHLLNDPGLVRVARGTYALAGTVPDAQVLPKQPRRSKRPRRGRAHTEKG